MFSISSVILPCYSAIVPNLHSPILRRRGRTRIVKDAVKGFRCASHHWGALSRKSLESRTHSNVEALLKRYSLARDGKHWISFIVDCRGNYAHPYRSDFSKEFLTRMFHSRNGLQRNHLIEFLHVTITWHRSEVLRAPVFPS